MRDFFSQHRLLGNTDFRRNFMVAFNCKNQISSQTSSTCSNNISKQISQSTNQIEHNNQTNNGELIVNIILSLVLGEVTQLIDANKKLPSIKVILAHGDLSNKLLSVVLEVANIERFGAAKVIDTNDLHSVVMALANAIFMALEKDIQPVISNKTKLSNYKRQLHNKSACLRFTKVICL